MIFNKLPFSITGLIQLSFFIMQVKYFNKRYEWACNLTASALREFIDMTAIKVTVIDFGFVFDLHGYYLAANHCLEPDNHAALFQGVYKDSCINYREKNHGIVCYAMVKTDLTAKWILHLTEIKSFGFSDFSTDRCKNLIRPSRYASGERKATISRWHFQTWHGTLMRFGRKKSVSLLSVGHSTASTRGFEKGLLQ